MLLERFHKFHVKTLLNGPKQLYKSCTNVQTKRLRERAADQVRSPISGKCKSVRLSCYRPLGENFFFSGQSTRFPLLTFIQLNSIVLKHFYKKKIQRQRCFIEMFRYDRFRRVEPSGKFHDNWNGLRALAGWLHERNFKEMLKRYMKPSRGFISQTKWPPCTWASTYLLNNQRVFWGQRGHVN